MKKLFLFFLLLVPFCFAQNDEFSIHGNFLSIVSSSGFDEAKARAGNFMLGGEYSYYLSSGISLVGGADLLWQELNGRKKISNSTEMHSSIVEVLSGVLSLGFNFKLADDYMFFLKGGYASGYQNYSGTAKGFILSGDPFNGTLLLGGLKYNLTSNLTFNTSVIYNLSSNLFTVYPNQEPLKNLKFYSISFGLGYNFFAPASGPGLDRCIRENSQLREENLKLNKDLKTIDKSLINKEGDLLAANQRIQDLETKLEEKNEQVVDTIDIQKLNKDHYIQLKDPYDISEFVKKSSFTEEGNRMLAVYESIAKEHGYAFTCKVPEAKTLKNFGSFKQLTLQSDSSLSDRLIIDIDIPATEKKLNKKVIVKE